MQFAHFFGDRAAKARTKQIEEKKEEKKEEKAASNEENEDDLIDINEFRKLMEDTFKPLNITITEEMVRWNFDKIDTDHSGRISFDEYMKFVKKYNSWFDTSDHTFIPDHISSLFCYLASSLPWDSSFPLNLFLGSWCFYSGGRLLAG